MSGTIGVRGALEEGVSQHREEEHSLLSRQGEGERRRRESKTMRSCWFKAYPVSLFRTRLSQGAQTHAVEALACVCASPASFSSPCAVARREARRDSTSLHSVGPQYVKSSVEDVGNLKCGRGTRRAISWMSTYGRKPAVASARMGAAVLTEHVQRCKSYAAASAPR